MQFVNQTRINPEVVADDIPVIHGRDYYIDEEGSVNTYTKDIRSVFNINGSNLEVNNIQPVTEFIYIINNKLAYKTTTGFYVTEIAATKEKYRGGFQGIAGFNETEVEYQYMNANQPAPSTVIVTGRLNSSKQLEIQFGDTWATPLGEFRCYINEAYYTVNYDTTFPNTFGDTFNVTLAGWTTVTLDEATNYIKDLFVAGNTLYLSTRLRIIGSTPFDWSSIDKDTTTTVWSEDTRLNNCYFVGNSISTMFFMINYNTSSIYWIDSTDLSIKQEYQHRLPILGAGAVDKFMIALIDKEALTVLSAYVSLNTWLIKNKAYLKLNQLSAYEEMKSQYQREDVVFIAGLSSIHVNSLQRTPMLFHFVGNKITSGCHTQELMSAGEYGLFTINGKQLYQYNKVEDNGIYDEIDVPSGITEFESYIVIGSDLEPDLGGSTLRDTEITYEGKISIVDGTEVSTESSSDKPISADVPVRTDQNNPDNWWYLYTKTLRYPVSYTDWVRISMMPTTKIFNVQLVQDPTKQTKKKK